ncbi:flagellar hook-length control protein FliK [Silvanigrella aquatica]|uniref:Flagellar hook-length control protein-like C-terminal domain-containing protein n=1 Tax=Silvanigrella aquatica TaxID=1915309 RepID=A0A1L4D232_9BACT|nr:flagellar hook-length control protein FliK [Silvanigrella aquatica]APJ04250.1 hypothetical protein AXG55_10160 [Silvanigrella aquatica]
MAMQTSNSGLFSIGAVATPPQKENNLEQQEPKKGNNNNVNFANFIDDLFAKYSMDDEGGEDPAPLLFKKSDNKKADDLNNLINSVLTPTFPFQSSLQMNKEDNTSFAWQQPKASFNTENKVAIDLKPVENFSIGDYKFYPIYPENMNISKEEQPTLIDKNAQPLNNLMKFDAVDLKVIQNPNITDNKFTAFDKMSVQPTPIALKDLQKGDLVSIAPLDNNKNIFLPFSKMNVEIQNAIPDVKMNNAKLDNKINLNNINLLEKGNPKQEIIDFGENFFGYPVSHLEQDNSIKTDYYLFKKESLPEGDKQLLIGILSKDTDNDALPNNFDLGKQGKPLLIGYQEDKPKFSKMMTLTDLKNNIDNLFNRILKNQNEDDFLGDDQQWNGKNFKPAFSNAPKSIFDEPHKYFFNAKDFENKDFFSNGNFNNINFKGKNIDINPNALKAMEDLLKAKMQQGFGNINFENVDKDKKGLDLSKTDFIRTNFEKVKFEGLNNKENREDSPYSFMSDSDNNKDTPKKELGEKLSLENKGISFEKGITPHSSSPIVVSDKSNADFSNTIISTATRRAVDLSNQLQARGGGTAKIQIQDDKVGSLELSIHMKKDNTVSMEIKASDKDLKNILEKNSDTLRKSLDNQNISLTDFKVSTIEKSIQTNMGSAAGQGFSQHQSQHNGQNGNLNNPDNPQQALNQSFLQNSFSNGSNSFFKNPESDFSFNRNHIQDYVNKNVSFKNVEKNSITNIQRGANGSIKVLV